MTDLAQQLKQIQTDHPWLRRVEITYSGSGDQGNIEMSSVNGYALEGRDADTSETLEEFDEYEVLHVPTEGETSLAEALWGALPEEEKDALNEAFGNIAQVILDTNETGCFDGDGGCEGIIGLDTITGHYALSDRIYYTESTCRSNTGAITEEGLVDLDE